MSLDKNALEKGLLFHERDRIRAAKMFKQKSKNLSFDEAHLADEEVLLNRFEPDWSKFENAFSRGMYALVHLQRRNAELFIIYFSM